MKPKNTLYLLLLIVWVALVVFFVFTGKSMYLIFAFNIWYALYSLLATVFSIRTNRTYYSQRQNSKHLDIVETDNIALLVTICDDFNSESAQSFLSQSFSNYHVFFCDDSKNEYNKVILSTWVEENKRKCTLLQRDVSRGFKAGNLNDSEKKIDKKFNLFCVVDSDQQISNDYLETIYNEYIYNDRPAFVQGIHEGKTVTQKAFSTFLSYTVLSEWKYQFSYRNFYGLPTILGHGYLISRDILKEAGMNPEIVSEDLALTLRLASKGYYGVFTSLVNSLEAYPEQFISLQKRRFKWTMADWEITFTDYFRSFIKSKVSFLRKIDILFRELRLPISTILMLMTVVYSVVSIISGNHIMISNGLETKLLMLLFLSPIYAVLFFSKSVKKGVLAFSTSLFVGLSMIPVQISAAIHYFIVRKAVFYVTNSKEKIQTKVLGPTALLSNIIDAFVVVTLIFLFATTQDYLLLVLCTPILFRMMSIVLKDKLEKNIHVFSILFIITLIALIILNPTVSIVALMFIFCIPFLCV